MVYFTLKDSSETAVQALVQACHRYLKTHDGVTFYAAGKLAPEFQRPVNDQAFHVALHVVFTDKAAHNAYQVSDDHQTFISSNRENWAQVRVFDAWVDG